MLKIAWNTSYTIPLPEGHRFPMIKYDLIPEQLLYEGTIKTENIFSPGVLSEEKLFGIHDQSYWYKLKHGNLTKEEIRKIGFPGSTSSFTSANFLSTFPLIGDLIDEYFLLNSAI